MPRQRTKITHFFVCSNSIFSDRNKIFFILTKKSFSIALPSITTKPFMQKFSQYVFKFDDQQPSEGVAPTERMGKISHTTHSQQLGNFCYPHPAIQIRSHCKSSILLKSQTSPFIIRYERKQKNKKTWVNTFCGRYFINTITQPALTAHAIHQIVKKSNVPYGLLVLY